MTSTGSGDASRMRAVHRETAALSEHFVVSVGVDWVFGSVHVVEYVVRGDIARRDRHAMGEPAPPKLPMRAMIVFRAWTQLSRMIAHRNVDPADAILRIAPRFWRLGDRV